MKPRLIHTLFIFSLAFLFSCGKKDVNVSLYRVVKSDFVDEFSVGGFAVPIETKEVVCPYFSGHQIIYLAEDGKRVEVGDTVCVLEDNDLISSYERAIRNKKSLEGTLQKRRVELASEYQLLVSQVASNKVDAEMHQFDSISLTFASPKQKKIQELELEKNSIQRKLLENKLKNLSVIHRAEIEQIKIEIQNSENEVKRVKEKLDAMVLKAPISGTLLLARLWSGEKVNVGFYPYSSMIVAQITQTSKMKVKMQLTESDYKRVNMADSTAFTFDVMPTVKAVGKITKKSPMGRNIYFNGKKSAIKMFDMEASIEKTDSMPQSDFTTNCKIVLDYIPDTIVVPNIAVFHQDTIDVVFVKTKRGFEKREVQLGKTSSKESIVEKGLEQDEVIALAEPNKNKIKSTLLLEKNTKKNEHNDTIVSKK